MAMYRPEARIMLQPIAAPSVLGNFALGSALIIYGSWFAGGWGTEQDVSSFFPFLLFFGGLGQLAAALWAYRARGAATAAFHGSWAAFWLGMSLMFLLVTTHSITTPARGDAWQSLGQWMIYMAVVSLTTAFAALAHSGPTFLTQATLAVGAAIAAAGLLAPSMSAQHVAGWFFVAAGTLAFFAGASLMLGAVSGKVGEPVQFAHGDPGVKVGQ